MPIYTEQVPLSLYIHLPWCVRKCPYCDFNSHQAPDNLPEAAYIAALTDEMQRSLAYIQNRSIQSIFFGGGTPSLFSSQGIADILAMVNQISPLPTDVEITLEANPGTIDESRFKGFYAAGVNRISLGIQSFQDEKLKALGRIHDSNHAKRAIDFAREAGFDNFNIDLMYGLPNQTISEALADLHTALDFSPRHLSWYQLTLEPNTLFYHQPPTLPHDETLWDMQEAGQAVLKAAGLIQYEVSAYAQTASQCRHNLNYWTFGDYLGIGAGAHSKISIDNEIVRFARVKHPKDYLQAEKRRQVNITHVDMPNRQFEFMLNAMRLTAGVPHALFAARTGSTLAAIQPALHTAMERGLIVVDEVGIYPTLLGKQFTNDLVELFLP